MSEQNTADNWRLEDTGETLDQWKLQEAEQTQMAQWQLQRGQAAEAGWQPVDYERQAPRRGSWVLPSLVGVALVAVFAYGVWIGLGALGLGGIANAFPPALTGATPTTNPVAVANLDVTPTATTVPPTTEPTATLAPTNTPTPVPTATPEPLKVEQLIARVTVAGGVNGRREPSAESEVVQILPQGQEYLITDNNDAEWMQVALTTTELVWISSALVETRAELLPLEVANQRRAALNLPALEASAAITTPLAGPVASAPTPTAGQLPTDTQTIATTPGLTATQPSTGTQPITAPVVAQPETPSVVVAITGTVNITAGLNARSVPTTTGQPVALLAGGAVVTITGRSADSEWLQIRLADNTDAWVFAQYIDISAAPGSGALPGVSTPLTTTNNVTTTTGAPATGSDASASVISLAGANARLSPDLNADSLGVIPYDGVLPVRGRTADGEWLQVDYEGRQVWILATTVSLSTELASLPVVTP